MAKAKDNNISKRIKVKITRPGVHAKTKTSRLKTSKNYKKADKNEFSGEVAGKVNG